MVMYDNDMIMSLKQKKIKFQPRKKLNHNKYIQACVFLFFRTSLVRMQEQVPIWPDQVQWSVMHVLWMVIPQHLELLVL